MRVGCAASVIGMALLTGACVPPSRLREVILGEVDDAKTITATPDAAVVCTPPRYVRLDGGPPATIPRKLEQEPCGPSDAWPERGLVGFVVEVRGIDVLPADWQGAGTTPPPTFGDQLPSISALTHVGPDVWVARRGYQELQRTAFDDGNWSVAVETGAYGPSRVRASATGRVHWLLPDTDALYRDADAPELIWNAPVDGRAIDDIAVLGEVLLAARPPDLLVFEEGASEPAVVPLGLSAGTRLAAGDGFVGIADASRVLVWEPTGVVTELAEGLLAPLPAAAGRALFVAHDGVVGRYDLP